MVNNVNAQQWLNEKYPIDGVCKRDNDPVNKGKKRSEITKLDISKGNLGKPFWGGEGDKILVESLKLTEFTNLRNLIISSHQLTELDVSNCSKLKELYCQNNQINNLNVTSCSNLETINCSSNNLENLDLSTCDNLEEVNISNCPELSKLDKIKSSLTYDKLSGKLIKSNSSQIIQAKENDVRNLLIVGMTGGGKSTLANVLSGVNNFEERDSSTSVTENFKKGNKFKWKGKNYLIIDNIGFSDSSNISKRDILFKIGQGIHSVKEGINQILFVVNGRFTPEQIKTFNIFKGFISESRITEFITIIRTNFKDFRNQERYEANRENLLNESQELREIINSCNNFIYVDNPPVPIVEEADSEDEMENKKMRALINDKKRKESREKVLNHLAENCLNIYKLKNWNDISSRVDEYIKREKEIEQSLISQNEKQIKKERGKELLAEEIKVRLEFSPVALQAVVEVEEKGLSCSIL